MSVAPFSPHSQKVRFWGLEIDCFPLRSVFTRQIFGAGGAIIQKKNKEKEKGKGKEERREKRKKERGELNLEDPMFLLISILSSKKL